MHHLLNRSEQATHARSVPRRALTALGRTIALSLLGIALTYLFLIVYIWWSARTIVLPVLAFVIVAMVAAGIVARAARWALMLGSLVALAIAASEIAEPLALSACCIRRSARRALAGW